MRNDMYNTDLLDAGKNFEGKVRLHTVRRPYECRTTGIVYDTMIQVYFRGKWRDYDGSYTRKDAEIHIQEVDYGKHAVEFYLTHVDELPVFEPVA